MSLGKKLEAAATPASYAEIEADRMKAKVAVMQQAAESEKVVYKSPRDPKKFIAFLKHRLTIWENLKK